jgi:hypothetical protein
MMAWRQILGWDTRAEVVITKYERTYHLNFDTMTYWIEASNVREDRPSLLQRRGAGTWYYKHPEGDSPWNNDWTSLTSDMIERAYQRWLQGL